ncbi:MAG: redoxin domain-containing protein [Bacillaceae bacterium]|nr:redoxin domain-containing protein [Bacillaceae bacterium]
MNKLLVVFHIILWIVVIAQGIVIFWLMRSLREFISRIQNIQGINMEKEISVGSLAPKFKVRDQWNNPVSVGLKDRSTKALLFVTSKCTTCDRLIKRLNEENISFSRDSIVIISNDILEGEKQEILNKQKLSTVISKDIFTKYSITRTPYIVLVNEQGSVQESKIVRSWNDVNNIVLSKKVG